ncbi:hypothetical protein VNN36_12155 (plasmid) [Lactococcus garvieae]|uniref:hypothetical protein n=1 Tax=Lactococcus garvieae TaxID=1363 RepID=UPI0030D05C40
MEFGIMLEEFEENIILKERFIKLENGKITSIIGLSELVTSTIINNKVMFKDGMENKFSSISNIDKSFEDYTGEEYLECVCEIKAIAQNKRKQYLEIAEILSIENDFKKRIGDYSFEIKKKIRFIQDYIGDSDTYIFHEPTMALDSEFVRIVGRLLHDLKNRNKTILLISNDINELQKNGDYLYIFNKKMQNEDDNF